MRILRVVTVRRPDGYLSICLDLGIDARGADAQEAVGNLMEEAQEYLSSHPLPPAEDAPILSTLVVNEVGQATAKAIDEAGLAAGAWVKAAFDGDVAMFWGLLSSESKGLWKGIWHERERVDLGNLHLASRIPDSATFAPRVREVMKKVTEAMPDLAGDCGLAPSTYLSSEEARIRLIPGITEVTLPSPGTQMPAYFVNTVRERGEWRVDYLSLLTPASLL